MYVKLVNVHGIEGSFGWYRKIGDCYDFVHPKELATPMTEEECKAIMKYKEHYCKYYDAKDMVLDTEV